MAWGDESCTLCNTPLGSDGKLKCSCSSKLVFRKEPELPVTALVLFYNRRASPRDWGYASRAFNDLSDEEYKYWEDQAAADRRRFEEEKIEYNAHLQLEEEILTDHEELAECECGDDANDIRAATQRRRCEQQWSRYRRDHRKFNESYKAPDQAVGPGYFHCFMELPTEIRNQIYSYILSGSRGTTRDLRQSQLNFESRDQDSDLRFTDMQPLDSRILVANREIYNATLAMLYSTNCFIVDVTSASILPLFVEDPTGLSAPRPTSRIRRWHIRLTFTDVVDRNRIRRQLIAVRDVMKQCVRLDEVRFSWISVPHCWNEFPGLVREYNAMLKLFQDLRGVGQVSYTMDFSDDGPCKQNNWLDEWATLHMASEEVREAVKASMESAAS
ncbi:MAG: hypothetical protein Q9208_001590 [Pyrenodesmia sp. 3 TL-2023]